MRSKLYSVRTVGLTFRVEMDPTESIDALIATLKMSFTIPAKHRYWLALFAFPFLLSTVFMNGYLLKRDQTFFRDLRCI